MLYNVGIDTTYGVNARTVEVVVLFFDARTNKLVKHFSTSAEIIQETETAEFYEIDFRRLSAGRMSGRILSNLRVQRFSKRALYGHKKEFQIESDD